MALASASISEGSFDELMSREEPADIEEECKGILPPHAAQAPALGRTRLRYALLLVGAIAFAGAVVTVGRRGEASSPAPKEAASAGIVAFVEGMEDVGAAGLQTSTTSLPFRESSKDWPSLFCWLVSQTVGGKKINRVQGWWEEKLVWEMYMQKVGIFACNEFAVFTDFKAIVSTMDDYGWPYVPANYTAKAGEIVSWPLGNTQTAKNGDSSPSNTWVFTAAWKALGAAGVLDKHQFVVKQDPDAVFFPWRLRWHASTWPSKDGSMPLFIKNCATFNSMQGPLEIFSVALVKAMLPNIDNCGQAAVGEDSKMEKCAQQYGQMFMDTTALEDKYCLHKPPDCNNGNVIAYHPFKEIPNFRECVEQSVAAEKEYSKKHPK